VNRPWFCRRRANAPGQFESSVINKGRPNAAPAGGDQNHCTLLAESSQPLFLIQPRQTLLQPRTNPLHKRPHPWRQLQGVRVDQLDRQVLRFVIPEHSYQTTISQFFGDLIVHQPCDA